MFSGTVDTCKWFFMQDTFETMFSCHTLQSLHDDLVVVYGNVCRCVDWSKFVLCRCNFIVLGL